MNPYPKLDINDVEIFIPSTEKMVRSYRLSVAQNEVKEIIVPRACHVICETDPAPALVEYTFGEQKDANDLNVWDKSYTGSAYLSGRGRWFIKHNTAGTVIFLVKDAGGAAAADAALPPGALPSSLETRLRPVVWGTPSLVTAIGASGLLVAANSARRALYVKNLSAGGQRITLSTANPAVDETGFDVFAQGEGYKYLPLEGVTTAAIYRVSSAAGGRLVVVEGT